MIDIWLCITMLIVCNIVLFVLAVMYILQTMKLSRENCALRICNKKLRMKLLKEKSV